MISQRVGGLLVEQIAWELTAHQTYTGIAVHFERRSLTGWGKWFREQAVEEAQHATKIMGFLTDNGVDFDLPALDPATTHYESALHAARAALDSERRVSERFRTLASTALAEGDPTSFQFVQWFIEEQVEEERTTQALVDLIESGINLFQAEGLLGDIT